MKLALLLLMLSAGLHAASKAENDAKVEAAKLRGELATAQQQVTAANAAKARADAARAAAEAALAATVAAEAQDRQAFLHGLQATQDKEAERTRQTASQAAQAATTAANQSAAAAKAATASQNSSKQILATVGEQKKGTADLRASVNDLTDAQQTAIDLANEIHRQLLINAQRDQTKNAELTHAVQQTRFPVLVWLLGALIPTLPALFGAYNSRKARQSANAAKEAARASNDKADDAKEVLAKTAEKTDTQLQGIHVLVNSNLDRARQEVEMLANRLADARHEVGALTAEIATLKAGVVPEILKKDEPKPALPAMPL